MKHKPKTDRNGQSSLSVHFKSFGRTNTDSDLKKNENSPEDDNSNVIAGSSHESTGNQSPDNGDAAVLFTKAKSGDESDGEIKISPSIQSADSLKQAEKRDYINASYIKVRCNIFFHIIESQKLHNGEEGLCLCSLVIPCSVLIHFNLCKNGEGKEKNIRRE